MDYGREENIRKNLNIANEFKMQFPTNTDALALAAIQIRSFHKTYRGILPDAYLDGLNAEDVAQDFGVKINDAEKHILITRNDDNIAGYALLSTQRMAELPFAAELIELYIDPAYTGKGIGKKLFQDALALCTQQGWTSLNVWALTANKDACGFYESMGGTKLIEGGIYWPDIDDQTFDAACYYWA